jgi:hypothetical protein
MRMCLHAGVPWHAGVAFYCRDRCSDIGIEVKIMQRRRHGGPHGGGRVVEGPMVEGLMVRERAIRTIHQVVQGL